MGIKTVLFDLDGTLLPMNQEIFTNAYFKGISDKVQPLGYEPMTLTSTIWAGTAAMVKNDGSTTNEQAFWNTFVKTYGEQSRKDIPSFNEFYSTDFQKIKEVCGYQPKAAAIVRRLQKLGVRVILATNPIFPKVATDSRIRWAGLSPDDFELITTYENSTHCKPNIEYYRDIISTLNLEAQNCLMVGNDVDEDMIATELGMQAFLLTDCLINKHNKDISLYSYGDFDTMIEYITTKLRG